MGLFKLDPGLALWTWASFLTLFFVLSRYVFPKLLQSLREREAMVAKSVDDAQALERQLSASEEDHKRILLKARAEADDVIRKAREEAETLRRQLAEKAENQADEILALARRRIEEDRQAAVLALTEELADFVCQASEKVIGKSFTGEAERTWTRELAERL